MKFSAIVLGASILLGVITGSLLWVVPAGIDLGMIILLGVGKGLESGENNLRQKDIEKAKAAGASDIEAMQFASQEATRRSTQIYGH